MAKMRNLKTTQQIILTTMRFKNSTCGKNKALRWTPYGSHLSVSSASTSKSRWCMSCAMILIRPKVSLSSATYSERFLECPTICSRLNESRWRSMLWSSRLRSPSYASSPRTCKTSWASTDKASNRTTSTFTSRIVSVSGSCSSQTHSSNTSGRSSVTRRPASSESTSPRLSHSTRGRRKSWRWCVMLASCKTLSTSRSYPECDMLPIGSATKEYAMGEDIRSDAAPRFL